YHGRAHPPKVAARISHIEDFDIMLCRTNLEALILECNLIKLHKPYYNILLKDDKHYPYIRIDLNDDFPRVEIARRMKQDGARYFGPYIGANAVNDVLETVKKVFPLRSCKKDIVSGKKERPCVNYEIGRCMAPCAGKCTKEEYRDVIEGVCRFLSGKQDTIIKDLRERMLRYSSEFKFEQAAKIRDQIRDIEGFAQTQQAIQTKTLEQDIISIAADGLDAMAEVLLIRGGKMVGSENYSLPGEGKEECREVLLDFILQYYEDRKPSAEVICSDLPEEVENDVQEWLSMKREHSCLLTLPKRGEKRALVLLAQKNAMDALKKRNARQTVQEERTAGACRQLAEFLHLDTYPRRIEAFDISNTQGELSVASMVVFINGVPQPKEYRHYRIKTVDGINDFESLAEVIRRRFLRAVSTDENEKWPMPDLVLIDGGAVQLAFSLDAMHSTGADVPMFGLAERNEEVYLPGNDVPLYLDRHSAALYLIERIRDEAHRFAITHHRALRTKKQTRSSLEDIEGIGPTKRRILLGHFKSVKAIKEASEEEIAALNGISAKNAHMVYSAMHTDDAQE
ncbi:MAG: excinuclease ABC subunit C, partial [Clostridiales bacterium]|nr:excinuclease ABC subunit C [Clostridiales bacterium]